MLQRMKRSVSVVLILLLSVPTLFAQRPAPSDNQKSIDTENFDMSVKPEEDFYKYVNGRWMTKNPIPADQSRWASFSELQEKNYRVLREILEEAAAQTNVTKGSNLQKVGDFYFSGMDSAAIEKAGATPLNDEFKRIADINNTKDVQSYIAHIQSLGGGYPFAFFVAQDEKVSTDVVGHLYQSGLGLPDRDYYTKENDDSKQLREKYLAHVTAMFSLLGENEATATANAATIMQIETRLAKASMTRVEQRDPEAIYHKMTVAELDAQTPNFSWSSFFTAIGKANPGNIIVGQPNFLKEFDAMMTAVPLNDWKVYLRWHAAHGAAEFLSSVFVNENFNFYGKTLTGAKELRPRWKRCLQTIDGSIGEALGELYVKRAFSPQAKSRAKEMVENLRSALRDRIKSLEWMSQETKEQALKKLNAFAVKIGYPDVWRDYSMLSIDRGPYVLNILRAQEFEFKRNLAQIGKPVDRKEWGMTPPTVNAYYNPNLNEIVFPAGILQPPFFDAHADDAVNYGGIGAVIGHEMTHGFDDEGRQFDAEGNLKDWWTKGDEEKYNSQAKIVEDQFNNYVALDTMHVNGKLTLGENIADLGGIKIAYLALQKSFEGKQRPANIDGFTPEQRFFFSWAQIWRENIRPEALKLRINTNPHSPGRFRCIGPISNMEEYAKAFNVKEGSPMMRIERAKIW